MSDQQTQSSPWHDPIVQELHDIRAQLVEKYQGNMTAYSQAAKAHALALGFGLAPMAGLVDCIESDEQPSMRFKDHLDISAQVGVQP